MNGIKNGKHGGGDGPNDDVEPRNDSDDALSAGCNVQP
jgi:hypothetical protein